MNTSRQKSKSFRLHHINKTSHIRKTSQSFIHPDQTFKLAALNSVTKGAKLADLSMMTGRDLNKLRVQPLQPRNGEEVSAHCSLMDVRQRYDQIKKRNHLAETHIKGQKEEINKLQIFKKDYQDKQAQAKNASDALEKKLVDIKALLEETGTELKVLKSLRQRHNTDKVVYDQRKYDMEQELLCKRKQIQIYKKEDKQETEGQDRALKINQKLQAQIQQEEKEREMHIQNLEKMIEEKMTLNNINSQREFELAEIASRAIQDKMQAEKNWRMVYTTHVFVNKMLRNKIDSEMKKFSTVEQAFKTIKTATGVSDAKTLISRYLNKESEYGQLLGKIADNERLINELKSQGDQLILESKALQAEKDVLQSTKIKELDLHQNIKELGLSDDKAIKAYSITKKLNSWVLKQFKKICKMTGQSEKASQSFEDSMKNYLNKLSALLQQVQGETLDKDIGSLGASQKNTRVMPKRSRKNSMGEQIFDVQEEELNPGATHEQAEFINSQHDNLIQTNDKFMKQLRIKYEEERKILIDKENSKAKSPVKVAEPKKEEEG